MPKHIVVDGSNIATEGRAAPSLKQLDDAVLAFREEHPEALITVVVDATFGHRIDPKESAEFDDAVSNNELVAPPAGAIGRGDAFVLSIANKVGATILSNDSYQEFHGEYPWLFDEGRLIGGKPVPHIGWVFVPRSPVRGPLSRRAVSDARRKSRGDKAEKAPKRQASAAASQPMPVPTAPPPSATLPRKPKPAAEVAPAVAAPAAKHGDTNELLPYLSFVERHPLGTAVAAVVERYSSHGAYVNIDGVIGYLPLRMMSDPPPRSAREFVQLGETISLVVESYAAQRRSIDLATPAMATARPPAARVDKKPVKRATKQPAPEVAPAEETPKPVKRSRKKAVASPPPETAAAAPAEEPAIPTTPAGQPAPRRGRKKAVAEPAAVVAAPPAAEPPTPTAPPRRPRKKAVVTTVVPEAPAEAPPTRRKRAAKAVSRG